MSEWTTPHFPSSHDLADPLPSLTLFPPLGMATGSGFYEYYTLLGLELPVEASWLHPSSSKTTQVLSPPSIKKAYRRASLKHHPDKGGDPSTFIVLKRAQKVLSDDGLRKRYDACGVDDGSDLGAGAPGQEEDADQAGANDEPEGQRSALKEISGQLTAGLMSIILRTAVAYFGLLLMRYRSLVTLVSLGMWIGVAWKGKGMEKNVKIIIAAVPLGMYAVNWSGAGGWLFYLIEALAIGSVPLFGFEPPHSPAILGSCLGLGFVLAWFFKGGFWPYLTVFLLQLGVGFIFVIMFPLCEHLVKEEVESITKAYAEKVKVAVKIHSNSESKNSS